MDIGTKGATAEFISELEGWVTAYSFKYKIKPESYASSTIADKLSKWVFGILNYQKSLIWFGGQVIKSLSCNLKEHRFKSCPNLHGLWAGTVIATGWSPVESGPTPEQSTLYLCSSIGRIVVSKTIDVGSKPARGAFYFYLLTNLYVLWYDVFVNRR